MLNINGLNRVNNKINVNQTQVKPQVQEEQVEDKKLQRVDAALVMANYSSSVKPTIQKPSDIDVNKLSFKDDLTPKDRESLTNILQKNDREAMYMQKMIGLVSDGVVHSGATARICTNNQMSDMVKNDLDIYFSKVKTGKMSVEDAFVPIHKTLSDAQTSTKIGDVFRVEGEDKIYVKSADNKSEQLEMDAKTYIKLFPPIERYATTQSKAGDCYLLSSINTIMGNENTRATIYKCFTQEGENISVKLPNGQTKTVFENSKMPEDTDFSVFSQGADGIKMLERAYGIELKEQKIQKFYEYMDEKIPELEKKLEKQQKSKLNIISPKLTAKKRNSISSELESHKLQLENVRNEMTKPDSKMTFALDDYGNFITWTSGPMTLDCNYIDANYNNPADFYRGNGGHPQEALKMFGYEVENFYINSDEEKIDNILSTIDPKSCIITCSTDNRVLEKDMQEIEDNNLSTYHAYCAEPFDDENGNRLFKVTNPWNQTQSVTMNLEQMKAYYGSFNIVNL